MGKTFKVLNNEGQEVVCEILFTFESQETGKNYLIYTDNNRDNRGNTMVYASIYDPTQKDPRLLPIETEHEWTIIDTIMSTLQQEIRARAFAAQAAGKEPDPEELTKSVEEALRKKGL